MHAINGNAVNLKENLKNAVVFLEFLITIVIFPYINTVVQNSLAEICTMLTCMMSAKCTAFNDDDSDPPPRMSDLLIECPD